MLRSVLRRTQRPTQLTTGSPSTLVKQPAREADHPPPPNAEVKNARSYTSTTICLPGVPKDNCALLYNIRDSSIPNSDRFISNFSLFSAIRWFYILNFHWKMRNWNLMSSIFFFTDHVLCIAQITLLPAVSTKEIPVSNIIQNCRNREVYLWAIHNPTWLQFYVWFARIPESKKGNQKVRSIPLQVINLQRLDALGYPQHLFIFRFNYSSYRHFTCN